MRLKDYRKINKYHPLGYKKKLKRAIKSLSLENQIFKIMDINAERELLIKELQQVEDVWLLQAIKAVLHYGLQSEGRISIEQYNRELEEAEARIERGEFITHEEAVNRIKGWRKTGS